MRVDFYILNETQPEAAAHYICRLLEKAVLNKHRVFVWCQDHQQAEMLDELLWVFRPDAFIPHHLQGEGPEPPPPVQIAWANVPSGNYDVLLNMHDEVPEFIKRFRRIIEVVPADEQQRATSRLHYRHYQQQGCTINTHKIE